MAPPDTRSQLLDAAERLFAEHGFRGASVRAITELAGANLAAVGYHFGSKAELLAAVVRRVVEPINAAQTAGLDRLLARTPDPPVIELVEAFAGPLFDEMLAGDERGARTSRLIMRIIGDPAEEMRTGPARPRTRSATVTWRPSSAPCPSFPRKSCGSGSGGSSPCGGGPRRGLQPAPPGERVPAGGRGGPGLGDHVPGGGDERATDRELTTRDGRSRRSAAGFPTGPGRAARPPKARAGSSPR